MRSRSPALCSIRSTAAAFAFAGLSAFTLPVPAATFVASGIDGAGFQNVVAADPFTAGHLVVGADVAGYHCSTNSGTNWTTSNTNLTATSHLRIGCVIYSATTSNKVYAGVGNNGSGGGLFISTDGGASWTLKSSVPQFSGANANVAGLPPDEHPRSTGNLIALDEANNYLYAATFQDGVMRSHDGGSTWTTIGLNGKFLRSIAIDPNNLTVLYAAAYNNKVWKITSARGTASVSQLGNSPAIVEELKFVGTTLYAAAGASGIYKTTNGGSTWTAINAGTIPTDGPKWQSIDGYVDANSNHVLFVGCSAPDNDGSGHFKTVYKSPNGGSSWSALTTDPTKIHFETGGPGGQIWWESQTVPSGMINGGTFVASQIISDPLNRSKVYVAGRAGVWRSTNGGTDWYPMVGGLMVTVSQTVAPDINLAGRTYVGTTDWTFLVSDDALATISQNRPAGADTVGTSIAFDRNPTPARVYVGTGNRDSNVNGEIYSNADPVTSTTWTDEGLSGPAGGKIPIAIAANRPGLGAFILLAAVDTSGIWRKSGSTWTKVNGVAMATAQSTGFASMSWLWNTNIAYLYDRETGVWRSTDSGVTWTKIWAHPSAVRNTGYVAAEPGNPTRLYVSANDGAYRLDNADVGTVEGGQINPVNLGITKPGPIASRNNRLYVTRMASSTTTPALFRSLDAGATFTDIADTYYRASALFPDGISVDAQGFAAITLWGNGAIRSSDSVF